MSAVNWNEVITRLVNKGIGDREIESILDPFDFPIHPHDTAQAVDAGLLRRSTVRRGLSLGDRACLALARALDAPALTADRAWADLDVGVEIEVIR